MRALNLKVGQIYNEEKFYTAIYNLNSKYMNEGYYFIKIDNDIVPSESDQLIINFSTIISIFCKL